MPRSPHTHNVPVRWHWDVFTHYGEPGDKFKGNFSGHLGRALLLAVFFCFESACQETKLIFKWPEGLQAHWPSLTAAFCVTLCCQNKCVMDLAFWHFSTQAGEIFKKQSAVMEFFVLGGRLQKWKPKILSLLIIFSDSHTNCVLNGGFDQEN